MWLWGLVSLSGLPVVTPPVVAQTLIVQSITDSRGDDIMTDEHWRTLYTYDLDYHDQPTCLDECAALWPPFEAARDALGGGGFAIVRRPDGKLQWSYGGNPLYYYSKDKQKFDIRGDGVGGVWHYARLPGGND